MHPTLFSSRTPGQQVLVANIVPAVFGLIVGIAAGVSAGLYLLLSLVGLAGAYFAGLEHKYPEEGLLRGAAAGLLFGTFILLGRAITGLDDKADIPPAIILLFITTVVSAIGGAIGATRRRKKDGGADPAAAPVGGV